MALPLDVFLDAMQHADDLIGLDTETTGLKVAQRIDHFTGLSVAFTVDDEPFKRYFPYRHPDDENNVSRETLELVGHTIVTAPMPKAWHNRKFDLHSCATSPLAGLFDNEDVQQYDTMSMAHLVNEEWPSKELDWLSKTLLQDQKVDEVRPFADAFGWAAVPGTLMAPYAEHDAFLVVKLWRFLIERIRQQGLEHLLEEDQQFCTSLYRMEQLGVDVNRSVAQEKLILGIKRMEELRDELGFDPAKPTQLAKFLFEDLGLPVLHTSEKTGKPTMNKAAMTDYDDILESKGDDRAKKILEYRGWQKATSALYLPITEHSGPDGRVRTNYRITGTVTGRLSSAEPNLQQVPRKSPKPWNGDAKTIFDTGIPGYVMMGYDYSQLEFRLAAGYGGEEELIQRFAAGEDPFEPLTLAVFGEFTDALRQKIKTMTYATLYGAGINKIGAQLGMSPDEILPVYESFKASIPGIFAVAGSADKLVKERGYVTYWNGRRRHIRDKAKSYTAFNALLQGGGAEVVKKALIRVDREVCDSNCQLMLQVHDELVFAIKEDMVEKYGPMIIDVMTDYPDFPVQFAVEGKVWNK